MRLFVALDLPPAPRAALAAHGAELVAAGGWRAVPDASLHLTLAFLGERPETDAGRIAAALPRAVTPCGPLALGAPVRLPRRAPRVAAVAVEDPSGRLTALQRQVAGALVDLGVHRPEARPFLPHVTVARRARGPAGEAPVPRRPVAPFAPGPVVLYRSRLHQAGARYEALASVPLP